MKFYFLGTIRVECEGKVVSIRRRKAQALLAYLAITGQSHRRESLATLFWPEFDQSSALSNLRRDLFLLKEDIGEEFLDISRDKVGLKPEMEYWLDVDEFRSRILMAQSHAHKSKETCQDCLEILTEAVELYGGDFLAEFGLPDSSEFDEWQFFQAENLRKMYAEALQELIHGNISAQDFEKGIDYARRWVALDSLNEEAHRQLMKLYDWSGHHTAALRQYKEISRLLGEELSIKPDEETQALYSLIRKKQLSRPTGLKQQSSLADSADQALRVPINPSLDHSQMIGREAEFQMLRGWLQDAWNGSRQVVFIEGEAGIGKTTLVENFLEEAKNETRLWIGRGQCLEQRGEGEAYMPVLEALERMCREPGGEALTDLLAKLAPTWLAQMPGLVSPEEVEALHHRVLGVTKERMLREMVGMIEELTRDMPMLLVLEDLHWSDCSTLDLISYLARRKEAAHLLVIGTFRPVDARLSDHPLRSVLHDLQVHGQCHVLPLSLLTKAEVRQYVETRFRDLDVPQTLADVLHQRTDGNPLFIYNVVDAWVEQGAVVEENGRWNLRAGVDELFVGVPDDLRWLIEEHIGQLSVEKKDILETASVVGMSFSAASIATGVDLPEEDVEAYCDEMAKRGQFLIEDGFLEWPDGTVASKFRFHHHLYQEVLYQRIPAGKRARLHRQIGVRLEKAYGQRANELAAELAVHFVQGRDYERSVEYLQYMAKLDLDRSAHLEGEKHLIQALDALKNLPDNPERAQKEAYLQAVLGTTYTLTQGWFSNEAERAYQRADKLSRKLSSPSLQVPALFGQATMYEMRGEFNKSQALLTERLELPHNSKIDELVIESHELLACSTFHQGAFSTALKQARLGLELFNPERSLEALAAYGDEPIVSIHTWIAMAQWFLGYADQALESMSKALQMAGDHLYSLANTQVRAAWLNQLLRDANTTREMAHSAVNLATQQGFTYPLAAGMILHGWALAVQGQIGEGREQILHGLDICRTIGAELDRAYFLVLLAEVHGLQGEIRSGLEALDQAQEQLGNGRSYFYEAEIHRMRGFLYLQEDGANSRQKAEACYKDALRIAQTQNSKALALRAAMSLSDLWHGKGKSEQAQGLLTEIFDSFSEGFDTHDLRQAEGMLRELA